MGIHQQTWGFSRHLMSFVYICIKLLHVCMEHEPLMDIFVDNLRTMRESGDPNNFGVEGAMLPLKTCFTPYVCRGAVIFAVPDQR